MVKTPVGERGLVEQSMVTPPTSSPWINIFICFRFQWSVQRFCLRKYKEINSLSVCESWKHTKVGQASTRLKAFEFMAPIMAVCSPRLILLITAEYAESTISKTARFTSLAGLSWMDESICNYAATRLKRGLAWPAGSVQESGVFMVKTVGAKPHRATGRPVESWRVVLNLQCHMDMTNANGNIPTALKMLTERHARGGKPLSSRTANTGGCLRNYIRIQNQTVIGCC